jgi:protein phosphatase 2C
MRQAAGHGEEGLVRKVVAAGCDDDGVRAARRRRRLELRRHGRKTSGEDEAVKKIRPKTDDGASSDSSADAARGILLHPTCLSHGAVSVIGRRREMEDAVAVARTFLSPASGAAVADGCGDDEDFFAVYDGHGGSRVAEACRDRMHVVLAEELRLRPGTGAGPCADARGMKEALAASFARVDGEVVGGAAAGGDADVDEARSRTVGSTAVVAVVGRRRIVVANCGDSRAVLSRGGVAVPLSTDHKVRTHTRTESLLLQPRTQTMWLVSPMLLMLLLHVCFTWAQIWLAVSPDLVGSCLDADKKLVVSVSVTSFPQKIGCLHVSNARAAALFCSH